MFAGAALRVIRWSRAGVWERLLGLMQERDLHLGMVFLDGTNLRAHQGAAEDATMSDPPSSKIFVTLLAAHLVATAPRLA